MLVYGIGYEGRTPEQLVGTLVSVGVQALVDVRLNAVSRRRGFAKRALQQAFDGAGIAYIHLPELGNERDNRAGFTHLNSAEGVAARRRYQAHLHNGSAEAVRHMLDLLAEQSAALLCYERDERHCHREVLIQYLQEVEPKLLAVPL